MSARLQPNTQAFLQVPILWLPLLSPTFLSCSGYPASVTITSLSPCLESAGLQPIPQAFRPVQHQQTSATLSDATLAGLSSDPEPAGLLSIPQIIRRVPELTALVISDTPDFSHCLPCPRISQPRHFQPRLSESSKILSSATTPAAPGSHFLPARTFCPRAL